MRGLMAAFVVLCFWTAPAAAQGVEDVRAGLELIQAGKYGEARTRLDAAVASQNLTPQQRGLAHLLRGLANLALSDAKAARIDLDQAIDLMEDDGTALTLRADLAWRMDDNEQAFKDVLRLAAEYPKDLRSVEVRVMWGLLRWLKGANREQDRFTVLETVLKAGYQPDDPGSRADGLVQEYMGELVARGRAKSALPWTERIIGTRLLLEMRVSGRFKPLWKEASFDKYTEPSAAVERERAHWEAEAGKHPKHLAPVLNRIQSLRTLGKWEPAISLALEVLKNLDSYEDKDEFGLWIRNELAYIYRDTGRAEEAMSVMKPVLDSPSNKQSGIVNQFINFSGMLIDMDKSELALQTVAKAKGDVSPFGQKFIDSVEACANHRLGRTAEADAAMTRLKTDPEENYSALSSAYLCLNRVDDAVALALIRLRDPDHRESMLMNLQTFKEWPNAMAPAKELRERWKQVRNHPDVVAEAEKHGRLLDIPLYPTYWGDV